MKFFTEVLSLLNNAMELKDKNEHVRIRFSNFKKQYGDQEPVFLDLRIEVTMDNATARETITIEFSDFKEFMKNLNRLDETLKHTFYLQHIDEQLQVKFEPQITGNIRVTGFLTDKQHENTLNFSFDMPPSEIRHVISEGNNIIDILA